MNERERTTKRASSDENGEDPMEGRLRAVFTEAYPRVKPSESLRQRVAEATAGYESRNRQSGPWPQLGSMRRWPAAGALVGRRLLRYARRFSTPAALSKLALHPVQSP